MKNQHLLHTRSEYFESEKKDVKRKAKYLTYIYVSVYSNQISHRLMWKQNKNKHCCVSSFHEI